MRVIICAGTACAVMGGSHLLTLEENLPEWMVGKVEIVGAQCLEQCKANKGHDAPYVKVGDEFISRATLPRIIAKLEVLLAAQFEESDGSAT